MAYPGFDPSKFSFPDIGKLMEQFKVPGIDVGKIVEAQRETSGKWRIKNYRRPVKGRRLIPDRAVSAAVLSHGPACETGAIIGSAHDRSSFSSDRHGRAYDASPSNCVEVGYG